tara:strand:+ start:128 stop:760 length:633 start_codon:yes stop_codon:yes gene_type:complete
MNFLIACDQKYYNDWGHELLRSIQYRNPWLHLHCHIVNPSNEKKELTYVDYTTEKKEFDSESNRLGYLQAVRFLAVSDKFNDEDLVITTDADTICTRSVDPTEYEDVCKSVNVLTHQKHGDWLCGLLSYGTGSFKKDYASALRETPVENWLVGHDQKVLPRLAQEHNFKVLSRDWMSIGKHRNSSVFYTLKGNDRNNKYFLASYETFLIK